MGGGVLGLARSAIVRESWCAYHHNDYMRRNLRWKSVEYMFTQRLCRDKLSRGNFGTAPRTGLLS
jgi:hypothetical protein